MVNGYFYFKNTKIQFVGIDASHLNTLVHKQLLNFIQYISNKLTLGQRHYLTQHHIYMEELKPSSQYPHSAVDLAKNISQL